MISTNGEGELSSNKGEVDHLHTSGTFKGISKLKFIFPYIPILNQGSIPFLLEPCLWCKRLARAENSTFYEGCVSFVIRS